ncbi:hypothetical protein, partial [Burkholderia ubonensis]|uniref:hypothetical protein n=1 Tax=Burkholderia ubonensis TaxID=101571 RepID=UPI001E2BC0E9
PAAPCVFVPSIPSVVEMKSNYRSEIAISTVLQLDHLRGLGDVELVIERCFEHRWLPEDITRDDVLLRLDTNGYISHLGDAYAPRASSLPIHLYTADEAHTDDLWRGWHGICGTGSTVHPVGGTHHSIMQPPMLNIVADSITAYLVESNLQKHAIRRSYCVIK